MPVHDMQAVMNEARRVQQAFIDHEVAQRKMVLKYAWLLCSCAPWPDPKDRQPAQVGCPVHGNAIVTLDGEII